MKSDFAFGSSNGNLRYAMIWPTRQARQTELATLVALSECTLVGPESNKAVDFALFDLCSKSDRPLDSISEIVRYLDTQRCTALVWTDMDGLEAAYAALPHNRCHFLVEADDVEALPILAGAYGRGAMERLHDRNREVEFGSLHRISDELAEFARTLSRIADIDNKSAVSDKPISFRPAPSGGFQPFPSRDIDAKSELTAKSIRDLIKMRRLRDSFFEAELFADPAWDILLDLMAARLETRTVSVSSLCIAAAVPPTTALRWITAMTESGMLQRQQDPDDARRVFIVLSDAVAAKLKEYFEATGSYLARVF